MSNKSKEFTITYLPLLIKLTCLESVKLPDFLGSTLRGAIGWTLLSNKPLYQYLFENRRFGEGKQDIVNPYVIVPPLLPHGKYEVDDNLFFQIVLISDAADFAMSLIHTLIEKQYLTLGAERKKFGISKILHGNDLSSIWEPEQLNDPVIKTDVICSQKEEGYQHCSIQLLTPLRIRRGGELLQNIDFSVVIRNISRRIIELTERYGGSANRRCMEELCERSAEIQQLCTGLEVKEIQRYSNRKKEKMGFDGLLGVLMFRGDLDPYISLLRAARVLHLGRNVTLGFGQVEVVFW